MAVVAAACFVGSARPDTRDRSKSCPRAPDKPSRPWTCSPEQETPAEFGSRGAAVGPGQSRRSVTSALSAEVVSTYGSRRRRPVRIPRAALDQPIGDCFRAIAEHQADARFATYPVAATLTAGVDASSSTRSWCLVGGKSESSALGIGRCARSVAQGAVGVALPVALRCRGGTPRSGSRRVLRGERDD